DKAIEQLKENQLAITEGIRDIVTLNKELPQLSIEDLSETEPSKKDIILDIENAFNDKDREMIGRYGFLRPKDLLKKDNEYLNPYYESVKEKRNKIAAKIAALNRTKTKDVSDEIEEKEDDRTSINKYLSTISDSIIAVKRYLPKQSGQGVRRYKQPKRNAYKLQDNQYGGQIFI
ncbi:MAG: hypothetical protein OIF32_05990, partial [Campylobacterales bacterium]|nr:hypothetical protein [Campylobacterales bacterium]